MTDRNVGPFVPSQDVERRVNRIGEFGELITRNEQRSVWSHSARMQVGGSLLVGFVF